MSDDALKSMSIMFMVLSIIALIGAFIHYTMNRKRSEYVNYLWLLVPLFFLIGSILVYIYSDDISMVKYILGFYLIVTGSLLFFTLLFVGIYIHKEIKQEDPKSPGLANILGLIYLMLPLGIVLLGVYLVYQSKTE